MDFGMPPSVMASRLKVYSDMLRSYLLFPVLGCSNGSTS